MYTKERKRDHGLERFRQRYGSVVRSLAQIDERIRDLCSGHCCETIENKDAIRMYLDDERRLNVRKQNLLKRKGQMNRLWRCG